ncbi:MAG: alpha-L-fucosidase [Phaeodactylibacter sp.]|nr:alpha-L-fucosidase [Phaeodactylibacter sp.]MCB9290489.1 alpha-L-fucosidase [Lewinellaceae bacterium]
MKRRKFLHSLATSGLGLMAVPVAVEGRSRGRITEASGQPEPTPEQKAWMELGFGMFIHFGINTYYDVEWSDGTLDPVKFNPEKLNTDQWCATAKTAGMKYVVLVTKHHDGFCLWPTKHTRYSVEATPWKGDLVGELVNSAHKHGLQVGFYYSLWDCHEKSHDTNDWAYVDFMKRQLEELLTQYGEAIELWFDGFWKKQKTGWTKKNKELEGEAGFEEWNRERNLAFISAWRTEGAYRWQMDHLYQYIKSLQPGCLVMNNSTTAYPGVPLHPVDIRSGEKYTGVAEDQKVWEWLGEKRYFPLQIEATMSVKGDKRFPSGNWFWHEWDTSALEKRQILNNLEVAGKVEANLLLNVGPSAKGLLREIDERTLKYLRE